MIINWNHGYKKDLNRGKALCNICTNSNVDSAKMTIVPPHLREIKPIFWSTGETRKEIGSVGQQNKNNNIWYLVLVVWVCYVLFLFFPKKQKIID